VIVVLCLLVSFGSFVLLHLGFQVVVPLACSIFLACELRIAWSAFGISKLRERIHGSA
jgi:hypothetical protein